MARLRHSQSQQNMQAISNSPAETLARIQAELLGLLIAASGESTGSLHSKLGNWRQRVSALIAEAFEVSQIAQQTAASGVVPRLYSQVGYATLEAGPPPSGPGQTALAAGADLIFNGDPYGPLPYSTNALGAFMLEANKVYRLTGNLQLGYSDPAGFATIYWVDALTNAILRNGVGGMFNSAYDEPGGSYSGLDNADILYATTVAQEVKLRVIEISAGTVDVLYGSNALVHEI